MSAAMSPSILQHSLFKTASPIILAALAAAGFVSAVLFWSSLRADRISIDRQASLMRLVISQAQESVAHDQESATVWDDAIDGVRKNQTDWIDANLGTWMHTYFGHDGAFILDQTNAPTYAFIDGNVTAAGPAFSAIADQVRPLAVKLRDDLRTLDQESIAGEHTPSPGITDLAVVKGHPAIISIEPIVSDTGDVRQEPGTEYLHVALRYLDGTFLDDVRQKYLFEDLRFSWISDTAFGEAVEPLMSKTGQSVGYLNWSPFRPGSAVMSFMVPVLGLLFLVTAAVLAFLILRLHKRSVTLRASEAEVRHLALHDTLTGVGNRLTFNNGLDELLLRREKTDQLIAVLYLDLDRFKHVNDTLGHPTGDELIRQFAQRLNKIIRSRDVIGRVGGDEFTIALTDFESVEFVESVCRRIIEAVSQPYDIDGNHINVGVSIGVSLAPLHGSTRTDLLRKADIALYHAKGAGRGRFAIFGQDMDAIVQERRTIEHDFRIALEDDAQITVLFQPLYSAGTRQVTGVEALARWQHPEKGWIAPDIFVPVAEDTGLMEKLGERVLRAACHAAHGWGAIKLAVNVSVVELRNPLYPMKVANILMATGLNPHQLELEVTESTLTDDNGVCATNINALRKLGVLIALDDFGTGFSSLSRLQRLSVDRIKVDKSFVQGLGSSSSDAAIVEAIIKLAHATGLKTTAEGVETVEQEEHLQRAGCDDLQGFLMSKPMTEDELSKLLQSVGQQQREKAS